MGKAGKDAGAAFAVRTGATASRQGNRQAAQAGGNRPWRGCGTGDCSPRGTGVRDTHSFRKSRDQATGNRIAFVTVGSAGWSIDRKARGLLFSGRDRRGSANGVGQPSRGGRRKRTWLAGCARQAAPGGGAGHGGGGLRSHTTYQVTLFSGYTVESAETQAGCLSVTECHLASACSAGLPGKSGLSRLSFPRYPLFRGSACQPLMEMRQSQGCAPGHRRLHRRKDRHGRADRQRLPNIREEVHGDACGRGRPAALARLPGRADGGAAQPAGGTVPAAGQIQRRADLVAPARRGRTRRPDQRRRVRPDGRHRRVRSGARRQVRDLLRAAHPRRHARRAAHHGLGAAAGAQQGQQDGGGPQDRSKPQLGRPPRPDEMAEQAGRSARGAATRWSATPPPSAWSA